MKINLFSSEYRITGIIKPTKAKGFKDLKTGDIIKFHTKFERLGVRSRGAGSYAPYITIIHGDNMFHGSFNEVSNRLENFEIVEVSDEN